MANTTEELIEELYEKFRGLPNISPIVRNGIQNDALPLAILQLVYSKALDIEMIPENIDVISRYVVAPPDSGIDMFIEIENGDEYYYHVIQVKNSELSESEIKACYAGMVDTIKDYLRNENSVKENLRKVIKATNFVKSYEKNCTYYVFHRGMVKSGPSIDKKVNVANLVDLDIILQSVNNPTDSEELKVPYEELHADAFNNYMEYGVGNSETEKKEDRAYICSIRGYDLAKLCEKYISTTAGRNILFGQNLRESLAKKSKTAPDMMRTIDKEPQRFWHYNNGITIIAEKLDLAKDDDTNSDIIQLHNFSIINGAQTTSTLYEYYIKNQYNEKEMEKLKKVYVLARLMEVTSDREFGKQIAISNNTQNPISSRDMVSKNDEQEALHAICLDKDGGAPHIFVQIRNGMTKPSFPRIEKHQVTTNEDLAQLAFASFLMEPFSAKNKRSTLFTKSIEDTSVLVNETYERIFKYKLSEAEESDVENGKIEEQGILFRKSKYDIDEALFIKYLYRLAKNKKKLFLEERMDKLAQRLATAESAEDKNKISEQMAKYQKTKEINNTCMFYCITLFYVLKAEYCEGEEGLYDYNRFYSNAKDNEYKDGIIEYFETNFLEETINIINESLGPESNVGNWVRRSGSQKDFLDRLQDRIAISSKYQGMYLGFVKKFKVVSKN